MKTIKILLIALVGILAVSCYNDFDMPDKRVAYTDEDMALMGLTPISIKQVKDKFGPISGTGTNDDFSSTKTLKFGAFSGQESTFSGLMEWPDASGYYIKGRVISDDRQGNIYKSLYIYDGTAGIELKLYSGLFADYYFDLDKMETQWVYVRLDGLYLGNYRMMLSIGGPPSDGFNVAGAHKYYANSNVDNPAIAAINFFRGERTPLLPTDIKEVTPETYSTLGPNDFCRLVRFKGVKIRYADTDYLDANGNIVRAPAVLNGSNSNPYPNWIVTDYGTPRFGAWYRWAFNEKNIRLYGSVLMSYNDVAKYSSDKGMYSIRTSGFSKFGTKPIPRHNSVGTVTGIYGIYAKTSNFAGGVDDWAQYQITVSRIQDLAFDEKDLLTDEEILKLTPADSYNPPVKSGSDGEE